MKNEQRDLPVVNPGDQTLGLAPPNLRPLLARPAVHLIAQSEWIESDREISFGIKLAHRGQRFPAHECRALYKNKTAIHRTLQPIGHASPYPLKPIARPLNWSGRFRLSQRGS